MFMVPSTNGRRKDGCSMFNTIAIIYNIHACTSISLLRALVRGALCFQPHHSDSTHHKASSKEQGGRRSRARHLVPVKGSINQPLSRGIMLIHPPHPSADPPSLHSPPTTTTTSLLYPSPPNFAGSQNPSTQLEGRCEEQPIGGGARACCMSQGNATCNSHVTQRTRLHNGLGLWVGGWVGGLGVWCLVFDGLDGSCAMLSVGLLVGSSL
jgi:hypothetical protein